MAWIVGDGFDYYNGSADVARSVWDAANPSFFTVTVAANTRFGTGQCLLLNAGSNMLVQKTIPTNEATLYVVLAFYRAGALSGTVPEGYATFRDGASAQCTVCFESGGNITLKRGDQTGTVVATYASAYPQDTWNHFQCRVVIDGSAGTFTVRKNGATTDTFAATGLNTRGGSANNYANVVLFGCGSSFTTDRVDDLFFFSGSGAAPNTWVGDVRAIALPAVADTAQKNFTPTPASSITVGAGSPSSTVSLAANTVAWVGPYTPTRGGLITQFLTNLGSALTGHLKVALYYHGGTGVPVTLVATATEVTNPASGNVSLTFPAGTVLSSGRTYWFAVFSDAAVTFGGGGNASALPYLTQAIPYTSGFPSPATGPFTTTGSGFIPYAQATISGNSLTVSELLANGDTDYIASSNPGDYDLYDLMDLPVIPFAVIALVSKVYLKKADAGARQGQIALRSAATDVFSPDSPLSTTYTYVARADAADPATGAAWTAAGVNAAKVGVKVTS